MNIIIQFIVFFVVFFALFYLINFYILFRLYDLFGIKRNKTFYIILIIIVASYPLAAMIDRMFSNFLTYLFYYFSSLWMGIMAFFLFTLVIYELVRFFIKIEKKKIGIIIVSFVLLLSIGSTTYGSFIFLEEIEIPSRNTELIIVQLSDIHLGTIKNEKYLLEIIERTNELNPDIVAITGDLIDGSGKVTQEQVSLLDNLNAPCYFVTGNHEVFEEQNGILNLLNNTKVRTLNNELVEFEDYQLIGVNYSTEKNHLENELKKLNISDEKMSILFYHEPKDIEVTNDLGIDLFIAGHGHNGQIIPLNFLVKMIYKYNYGLYKYNSTYIYVSSGVGTWGPVMRLGSKNEIVLIEIIKQ
jgi:hypothetical protein